MRYSVGVGDMKVATKEDDVVVTHALGSCLGLMIVDPEIHVGGLLHAMLPLSKINPQKAADNPAMFVDTGVSALLNAIYSAGAQKARLIVKVAGCGEPLGNGEMFRIGKRNYTVLKKLLWKNGLLISAEDVGGPESRTVTLFVANGDVTLKCSGKQRPL